MQHKAKRNDNNQTQKTRVWLQKACFYFDLEQLDKQEVILKNMGTNFNFDT